MTLTLEPLWRSGQTEGHSVGEQVEDLYSYLEQEESQFQLSGRDTRVTSGQFRMGAR